MSRYKKYISLIMEDNRYNTLDFSKDGFTHYVYRVKDLTDGKYYYGSRSTELENLFEDFSTYGTSSKRKYEILNNSSAFKVKILKFFDNKSDMYIYESFLHDYFNVKDHNLFFNEANQTPFGFNTKGLNYKNSDETKARKKIANKNKGNCLSSEKISEIKLKRSNDIDENGLNSYQRAGMKVQKTLARKSVKEKEIQIKKRKETISEAGLKAIQAKTMKFRKENNLNSEITKKRNQTVKRIRDDLLNQFRLKVIFESGETEYFEQIDVYYNNCFFPHNKYYHELKKIGYSKIKGIEDEFQITLNFDKRVIKQNKFKKFDNALIIKERK